MTDEATAPIDQEPAPDADPVVLDGAGQDEPAGTVLTDDGPQGAPEKYADFTVPEGMTLDTALLEKVAPKFKEQNLSQEQAQGVIDLYAEQKQAESQAQTESLTQATKDWLQAAKSDTEIGGPAFEQNVGKANAAIAKFGTPELKTLLNETGLGNHPELIRVFSAIGKQIAEDDPGGDETPTGAPEDPAATMYPNEAKKRRA